MSTRSSMARRFAIAAITALFAACGPHTADRPERDPERATSGGGSEVAAPTEVTISVVGTNDLHGHIAALPLLAGYLVNLRAARQADGGAVLLVDAGDMFQGTLESNLVEGASVIAGMNELDYTASAVGNHEFDYGPVGDATTPQGDGDDPRGALIARAGEAEFPILTANILDRESGERVDWHDNMPAHVLVERAGVKIGIVGISTEETLRTTIAGNVRDLAMRPLADTIRDEAAILRGEGAQLVVVSSHAGGKCEDCTDPNDNSSCEESQEIFEVANDLPPRAVDLIVAGHTHRGVAHFVNDTPVIESYAYGIAFGRVDYRVDVATGEVLDTAIHAPRFLCPDEDATRDFDTCDPGEYEGRPVERVDDVERVIAPFLARAEEVKVRDLGVSVVGELPHETDRESALGNLIADLVRMGMDGADVGVMNGGGIRAALPAGNLSYGGLYAVFPFDNRFARVELTGAELAQMVRRAVTGSRSMMYFSGIRADITCEGGELRVALRRENGRRIRPRERLVVAASDFLATGGSQVLHAALEDGRASIDEGPPMRERLAQLLTDLGRVDPADRRVFDPDRPRIRYAGERPVRCGE